ncbi:MAG: glycosyltransferase [Cetobacterium sp.]|uniref:glycosyltransferase n=1 Tax=Cetobacterium sp. TaxID=2071632 RepID=UPI003F3877CB
MKVFILTSKYLPYPDANGVCASKIVKELVRRGVEVSILSIGNENKYKIENNIKILEVKTNSSDNKTIKYYIKRILNWPYISYILIFKIIINILKYKMLKFDDEVIIVPIIKPFDNIKIALLLKKIFKKSKLVPYILDSLESELNYSKFFKKIQEIKMKKIKFLLFKNSEIIIKMKYDYSESRNSKIIYCDIPLFELKKIKMDKYNETKRIVYAGTLSKKYRNPDIFLNIMSKIKLNIKLDIYGDNKFLDEEIKQKKLNNVFNIGMISHEEVIKQIEKANILLSIGNKGTNQLPSKIFEYMSYQKPIIHVFFDENDAALNYLKKYPLIILINANDSLEKQIKILEEKIVELEEKNIDLKNLVNIFYENTAIPFSNILENIIKNRVIIDE